MFVIWSHGKGPDGDYSQIDINTGYIQTQWMTCYLSRKSQNWGLFQENIQFLFLCFNQSVYVNNQNSEGNIVCKFPYFRKYSETTYIAWSKVSFLQLCDYIFQITDSTSKITSRIERGTLPAM